MIIWNYSVKLMVGVISRRIFLCKGFSYDHYQPEKEFMVTFWLNDSK